MDKDEQEQNRVCSKGFILVSSYMVLSSLMLLTVALWWHQMAFLHAVENSIYKTESFHLAESGIDDAIVNLESDLSYFGTSRTMYSTNGVEKGSYTVVVENPDSNNPYRKKLTSTALTKDLDEKGRGQFQRTVITYIDLVPRQTFEFAMFAERGIELSGSPDVEIDSYDSEGGDYSSPSAGENADIMTNSIDPGAIFLEGNVTVKGNATVGQSGDPSTAIVVGPNSSISGTKNSAVENKHYETSPVPKSAVEMGDRYLDAKQILELPEGTYVFDSLTVEGKAVLSFTGPATVFLRGPSYIAGNGVATVDNRAKNLIFHVSKNYPLTYAGNANLYAGIYAPESTVDVSGNAEVLGAVIADTYIQRGGGRFHFDEDLKSLNPDEKFRSEIVSWQEQDKYLML